MSWNKLFITAQVEYYFHIKYPFSFMFDFQSLTLDSVKSNNVVNHNLRMYMRNIKNLAAAITLAAIALYSCSPDSVRPVDGNSQQGPTLAGALDDPHPALDTICQETDTIFLVREDDGSPVVNKCFGLGGIPITCPPGQFSWGHLVMREGYFQDTNYVDCDFSMAPGWYCDFNNWQFGLQGSFNFDQNGIPIVSTDWGVSIVNPAQNKWQLRLQVADLETPCFYVALRVNAVKLNLFGLLVNGSQTLTWGKNLNWNNPSHAAFSGSPWLTRFCPDRCLEAAPPIPVDSSCKTLYTGISNLSNCTTIAANTTGLTGNLSYQWSTGATTSSVTVCPTSTATYTVTVSSNGTPVRISATTVYKVNAACGNGNGNNGFHKVWVCHVPPGNPNNAHEICIDWNGVPAHVARFRSPNANPNQGHDSGCEIGRCGSNPCL